MRNDERAAYPLEIIRKLPDLDAESAIEAIGGSDELYERLLRQIVRLTPSHLDLMDKGIASDDLRLFAVTAHGVKGSFHQVGHLRLSKAAESLEVAAKSENMSLCIELYPGFRKELICFYKCLSGILDPAADENAAICQISDYKELLIQARDAIEEFDSLTAAEVLSPMRGQRFGGETDLMVRNILDYIDSFQVREALEAIGKLFESEHGGIGV